MSTTSLKFQKTALVKFNMGVFVNSKRKKNTVLITFMASTSIVEATKSPDVEVPASLGIQVEADRSLETVVAASDGSS